MKQKNKIKRRSYTKGEKPENTENDENEAGGRNEKNQFEIGKRS